MPRNRLPFERALPLASFLLLTSLPAFGQAPDPAAPAAPTAQGVEVLKGPIRVGDVIRINVIGDTTITGNYTVDTEGRVNLPLAGPLKLQGLQPVQASERVARFLVDKEVIRRPQVTLTIAGRPLSVVYLSGALKTQGRAAIKDDTRLSEVLDPAGTLPTSDLARVVITRGNKDITVNYRDFVEGKDRSAKVNPPLREGDKIYVYSVPTAPPVSGTYKVFGEVKTPQSYTLNEGVTVGQALQQAGDVSALANLDGVYIQRGAQRIPVPLKAIRAREAGADIPLQTGDEVYVPRLEKPKVITVAGAVRQGGQQSAESRLTLLEAIAGAGGPTDGARQNEVEVRRTNDAGQPVIEKYNIEKAEVASVELKPGDYVFVPYRRQRPPVTPLSILGAVSSLFFLFRR